MNIPTPHEVIVQVLGNTGYHYDGYAADILDALAAAGYVIASVESLPPTEQVMPSMPQRLRLAADTLNEATELVQRVRQIIKSAQPIDGTDVIR